jgi:hypothetical protein
MKNIQKWLSTHKYGAYTTTFLLMILPVIPLYVSARAGSTLGMLVFIGMFVLGNILALLIR